MEFTTIAILDDELFSPRVRNAGAFQFTDYETKKIKIIAPSHKADDARKKLFSVFDLVNIFDRYYLITAKGKTEITEMEYSDLKRQMMKRYE